MVIDLVSFRKHSYCSNLEARNLIVLELIENIFGPVPFSPVKIDPSIFNKTWPRFDSFSAFNFTWFERGVYPAIWFVIHIFLVTEF